MVKGRRITPRVASLKASGKFQRANAFHQTINEVMDPAALLVFVKAQLTHEKGNIRPTRRHSRILDRWELETSLPRGSGRYLDLT
jgi:hypothetical protein